MLTLTQLVLGQDHKQQPVFLDLPFTYCAAKKIRCFVIAVVTLISFQLFDKDNHLNRAESRYVFNTEGHVFPIDDRFRRKPWETEGVGSEAPSTVLSVVNVKKNSTFSNVSWITEQEYIEWCRHYCGIIHIC